MVRTSPFPGRFVVRACHTGRCSGAEVVRGLTPVEDGMSATAVRSYGCCDRGELGKAIQAAHNAATAATKAKKAMRPMPLPAATTALTAKMPEVKSQKLAGAASRWSATTDSVQGAGLLAAWSSRRPSAPDRDRGGPARGGSSSDTPYPATDKRREVSCAAVVPKSGDPRCRLLNSDEAAGHSAKAPTSRLSCESFASLSGGAFDVLTADAISLYRRPSFGSIISNNSWNFSRGKLI